MRILAALLLALGACTSSKAAPADPLQRHDPEPREPTGADSDGDAMSDDVDLCPGDPEDMDGFEDDDGCPDPDNDRDRILDVDDACPNEMETYNGANDEDGCPP